MNHRQALGWRCGVVLAVLLSGCTSVRELRPGVYRISAAGNSTFGAPDLARRLEDKAAELCGGKYQYTSTVVHSANDSAFINGSYVQGEELGWEIICNSATAELRAREQAEKQRVAQRLAEDQRRFEARYREDRAARLARVVADEQEACRSSPPGAAQPPASLTLELGRGAAPLWPGKTTSAEVLRAFGCEGRISRAKDEGFVSSVEYRPSPGTTLNVYFHDGVLQSASSFRLPVTLGDGTVVTGSTLDQLQSRLGPARAVGQRQYQWRSHGLRVIVDDATAQVDLVAFEKSTP